MEPMATQLSYCSRCGDEIPPDELQFLQNTSLCALCCNTQLECMEIYNANFKKSRPVLTLVQHRSKSHDGTTV
jgi:RNA polymerase-binding transcription factor DksA